MTLATETYMDFVDFLYPLSMRDHAGKQMEVSGLLSDEEDDSSEDEEDRYAWG